jgi:hypothetical protein
MMTAKEVHERYKVDISEEQLAKFRAERRRAKGPPFRLMIEYPSPVLTPEEKVEAFARAQSLDELGIADEPDPASYTILRAQNAEDAKIEADRRWQTGRHDDGAIGYVVCADDWS